MKGSWRTSKMSQDAAHTSGVASLELTIAVCPDGSLVVCNPDTNRCCAIFSAALNNLPKDVFARRILATLSPLCMCDLVTCSSGIVVCHHPLFWSCTLLFPTSNRLTTNTVSTSTPIHGGRVRRVGIAGDVTTIGPGSGECGCIEGYERQHCRYSLNCRWRLGATSSAYCCGRQTRSKPSG